MGLIGSQFHSIRASGMMLFTRPIESLLGSVTVDLVSAPIEPGDHRLQITSGVGGVEIFVPSYVEVLVDGGPMVGGQDVHDGHGAMTRLGHRILGWFGGSPKIPAYAVAPSSSLPTRVHLVLDGVAGGLDIYRLSPIVERAVSPQLRSGGTE
ncbi:hypothetical protein BH11MYX2_BH11MYX2_18390 [soil metagenome]